MLKFCSLFYNEAALLDDSYDGEIYEEDDTENMDEHHDDELLKPSKMSRTSSNEAPALTYTTSLHGASHTKTPYSVLSSSQVGDEFFFCVRFLQDFRFWGGFWQEK